MYTALKAIYQNGKLIMDQDEHIPNGAKVLVTVVSEPKPDYLVKASEKVLEKIWDNKEDDIYEELLEK
ncbi:hypothetical protein ACFLSQ_08535 [Bacteroidota bacterium]